MLQLISKLMGLKLGAYLTALGRHMLISGCAKASHQSRIGGKDTIIPNVPITCILGLLISHYNHNARKCISGCSLLYNEFIHTIFIPDFLDFFVLLRTLAHSKVLFNRLLRHNLWWIKERFLLMEWRSKRQPCTSKLLMIDGRRIWIRWRPCECQSIVSMFSIEEIHSESVSGDYGFPFANNFSWIITWHWFFFRRSITGWKRLLRKKSRSCPSCHWIWNPSFKGWSHRRS